MAAFLLRMYQIGQQEIWVDEAASFYRALAHDWSGNGVLYHLLLRVWIDLVGQTDAALRSLSAIFGTVSVMAVIWAGRTIFGRSAGLWSGFATAISPIHIYYSQEARPYALLILALLLAYVLLWRALEVDAWQYWAGFSAAVVTACLAHDLAAFGLLPTAFIVLLWPGKPQGMRRWLRFGGSVLASATVLAPWALGQFSRMPRLLAGTVWVRGMWEQTPPPLAIPKTLEVFGLGGQAGLLPLRLKQFTELQFPQGFRLLGIALLLLLGVWAALPWREKDVPVAGLARRKACLWIWLFVPLVSLWLLSHYRPLYLVGRYDLVAFPAYVLLLGVALAKLHSLGRIGGFVAPVVVLLLCIPVGAKLFLFYRMPSPTVARGGASILHTFVNNGDVVVFTGLRGLPTLYYLGRMGYRWEKGECRDEVAHRRFACRMYPRETEQRPAVLDLSRVFNSPDAVREDVQDFLRMLRPEGGEVWVALESANFGHQMVTLHIVDALLFQELQRLGLKPVLFPDGQGIFRFRGS